MKENKITEKLKHACCANGLLNTIIKKNWFCLEFGGNSITY